MPLFFFKVSRSSFSNSSTIYPMRIHLSQSTRRAHKSLSLPRYTSLSCLASTSTTIACSSISTFATRSRVVLPLIRNAGLITKPAPTQLGMSTLPIRPKDDDEHAECTAEMKEIEDSLHEFSLQPGFPWGFVVYRVAYGDGTDAKWSRLLQMLAKHVESDLMRYGKMDSMGARHQLVAIDDRGQFEGMTTHDVRKHFRSWVVDELDAWWVHRPSPEEIDQMRTGNNGPAELSIDSGLATRWNICVYVDDSCLDSLDNPWPMIKLVWKDWWPHEIPEDEYLSDTEMPPDIDVGWTDLRVAEYNWMYGILCDQSRRYDEYRMAAQGIRF